MHTNKNNYNQAQQLSERALAFMANHAIAPHPINYAVIYHYVSNENIKLKEDIEKKLLIKGQIDDVFLEAKFNEYLSASHHIENLLLSPFENTLNKTLDKIDAQVTNEQDIAFNLKKVGKALSNLSQHQPLNSLINFIVNLINNSQSQRKSLADELTHTFAEVKLLRTQLTESREKSAIDTLTGLLNHRGCQSKLQTFDPEKVHSTIAIDIDQFTQINEGFGHAVGDKVIQLIANIIKKSISPDDIAARLSGEEFIIIMNNKSTSFAINVAEKIRVSVEKLKLIQKQTQTYLPKISVSLGIAELDEAESWDSLFKKADKAMCQAKELGKNRCVVIKPDTCLV
ncbi:GGDEF domain-containing protein [Thalassotalea piscium]